MSYLKQKDEVKVHLNPKCGIRSDLSSVSPDCSLSLYLSEKSKSERKTKKQGYLGNHIRGQESVTL